ncbi:hypothetical protein ACS6X2_02345 [Streptococcus suis]
MSVLKCKLRIKSKIIKLFQKVRSCNCILFSNKINKFFRENLSIFISLLALSVTLNNARISTSNTNLDALYQNSTLYISNLNKLDLIYSYRKERTTSIKKEEIDINVTNKTIYELIKHSINQDNKYATELIRSLENVTNFHKLEVERLNQSFHISILRASGEVTKTYEAKYKEIEEAQDKLGIPEDDFSSALSKYYDEEKRLNRFKLLYFF